jgi:lipopolysaccharide cholinephosphotransferase
LLILSQKNLRKKKFFLKERIRRDNRPSLYYFDLVKFKKTNAPYFLDIFILERISRNNIIHLIQGLFMGFFILVESLVETEKYVLKERDNILLKLFKKYCYIPKKILISLKLKPFMNKIYIKLFQRNPIKNENYLLRGGKPIILEKKDISPLKRLKFEDRTFPVLNNYKKFLKIKYGDYLKLPPIEERKPVHGLD